ncbi:helix-turn-helix transcriptional regulator [Amycolatopsis sp. CA-230715]|uniref:helix-turn-helix transcriptional regulator n=1 Tax=Amycolatopsis sp. CA-230715 TaxID=2745196 RepID=UPI001C039C01|nr:AraC family transcriptional regulator [Amycolatopsis sp. CA-230715]QWF78322.1 hypothetical protein HUW46_01717 [Amycolatopsis sp. CA-230715]
MKAGEKVLFEGRDLGEIRDAMAASFGSRVLHAVKPGPDHAMLRITQLGSSTGDVRMLEVECGPAILVRPDALEDRYLLSIPLQGTGWTEVDGEQVDTREVLLGPAHTKVSISRNGGNRAIVLHFTREAIDAAAAERLGREPGGPTRFDPAVRSDHAKTAAWLALARTLADTARRGLLDDSPLGRHHLEQLLIHGLFEAQPHTFHEAVERHEAASLPAVVRRAVSFCEENASEPITVSDMAKAAGTSVRALQRGFRSQLGMSPLAHLRQVRLARVHEDLRAIGQGDQPGTVTEVALRWGFPHLGRFSQLYRETYGEPPSHTLRSA